MKCKLCKNDMEKQIIKPFMLDSFGEVEFHIKYVCKNKDRHSRTFTELNKLGVKYVGWSTIY